MSDSLNKKSTALFFPFLVGESYNAVLASDFCPC